MRTPATAQGREHAIAQLKIRRAATKGQKPFDNSSLPAGSPMVFPCIGCGYDIVVPEDYLDRPKLCRECDALTAMGWME